MRKRTTRTKPPSTKGNDPPRGRPDEADEIAPGWMDSDSLDNMGKERYSDESDATRKQSRVLVNILELELPQSE